MVVGVVCAVNANAMMRFLISRPTHRATPEVEEGGEACETRSDPGGDWEQRTLQAPHRGQLQHPHQLQLVSHFLGQVRILGFILPPVTLSPVTRAVSVLEGVTACQGRRITKIKLEMAASRRSAVTGETSDSPLGSGTTVVAMRRIQTQKL